MEFLGTTTNYLLAPMDNLHMRGIGLALSKLQCFGRLQTTFWIYGQAQLTQENEEFSHMGKCLRSPIDLPIQLKKISIETN